MQLTLEHSVHVSPRQATARVLDVASMFGLGADASRDQTIIPRTEVDLPIPGPGVVFITGSSGSGKSTLLRLIAQQCEARGARVLQMHGHTERDDDGSSCVIDLIAPDQPLAEALEVLSMAGLGDAFALLRRPGELSDGQRFRFRLAGMLAEAKPDAAKDQPRMIVIDEFAATLDRLTAQTLARNVRRWSDRTGVTFIVATTHDDLADALAPDVLIRKPLGAAMEITTAVHSHQTRTAERDQFLIEPGTMDDYRALAHFHYRPGHPGGATSVLRVVSDATLVGVLVRSLPALACRLRDIATGDRYARLTPHERGVALNREVRCVSRVIIDPRFRGLGLAVRLVRHALEHPENESVVFTEALAAMGRVSPFFERAGMRRFELPVQCRAAHARLLDALHSLGLAAHDLTRPVALDAARRALLVRETHRFLRHTRRLNRAQLAAMSEQEMYAAAHERLMLQPVYFLFRHSVPGTGAPGFDFGYR